MNPTHLSMYIILLICFLNLVASHSVMSYPKPTSPNHCRMGGIPRNSPIGTCPGPCELRNPGNLRSVTNPGLPAAIWRRGQSVTIKYQRNNHGPGGFVRISLVPISKMMDKETHTKNAFHYSCWGANPVVAKQSELGRDSNGYSLTGNDGALHTDPMAYLTTNITIPKVVPDGNYALGWVWFGGVGGSFERNTARTPKRFGFFSDYWSCAFVRISGGAPLAQKHRPMFNNDMKDFWKGGCNAQFDEPGKCVYEPCTGRTTLQKPKPFKNGAKPEMLTPAHFRGDSGPIPKPPTDRTILENTLEDIFRFRMVPL